MKLIKPSIEFLWLTPGPLNTIESAGRTCYKSEERITHSSCIEFVKMLLKREHYAMLEHASMSYRLICDRGVSHELVRHRLFSFAQESTRYMNYKKGITCILPPWCKELKAKTYKEEDIQTECGPDYKMVFEFISAERRYKDLIEQGWTPQQARSVLPNSLKTEIVVTGNLREWRHFFSLRTAPAAHPQMREIAIMVLKDAVYKIPIVFDEYLDNIKKGE
jgi:thymidylate synthase (FAD)